LASTEASVRRKIRIPNPHGNQEIYFAGLKMRLFSREAVKTQRMTGNYSFAISRLRVRLKRTGAEYGCEPHERNPQTGWNKPSRMGSSMKEYEILTEQEIIHDAMSVLMKYLTPDKLARYWSAMHMGEGDYPALRKRLFEGETVETLYKKIQAGKTGGSSARSVISTR
jgi:hypothetical protein